MANLNNQIDSSKKTLQKGNETLERFYKGFRHFQSMNVGDNFIVYKLPSAGMADESIIKAQERIKEKNLPLKAIRGNSMTKTFIVQTI